MFRRSTANALEAAAALHTDTIVVLDELGAVEAKEAAAAIYSLTGGTGKGRSRRDGSLRQSLTWRTMVLSTGEVRLTDKLIEGRLRARAGQQVRLVDIPADADKGFGAFDNGGDADDPKELADKIKIAAQTSYGIAGPEFVRRLIADGIQASEIKTMIDAFRKNYAPIDADGQVLRVVDRFGLVAAAGELACDFGVVPWKKGEAIEASRRCFTDWYNSRGGTEAGEVLAAIAQVRFFIEQHGDSRFEYMGTAAQERPVNNRAGWRKGEGCEREWLVPTETWRSEVARGHDPQMVARALADRGMLRRSQDGNQCVERAQGRPQRFYVVTASILSEPNK